MIIDYIGKKYTDDYTCWDFCREYLIDYENIDIGDRRPDNKSEWAKAFAEGFKKFKRIRKPVNNSIVIFRSKGVSHAGIVVIEYGRKKVLHLQRGSLSKIEPLSLLEKIFEDTKFYDCKPLHN